MRVWVRVGRYAFVGVHVLGVVGIVFLGVDGIIRGRVDVRYPVRARVGIEHHVDVDWVDDLSNPTRRGREHGRRTYEFDVP